MNKVGLRTLALEDPSRPAWSSNGNRPLLSEVWYPASDNAEETIFSFGTPEPLFQFDSVAIEADLQQEKKNYPLVVLSHGTGGSALQMGWLAWHLAAHGYIAVAVNHHGNNSLEPYLAHGFLLWWERAKDLTLLIDLLLNDVTEFKGRIDENRIGVSGFSLGGYTAIELVGGRCSLEHFEAFCTSEHRDAICEGPKEFPGIMEEMPRLESEDKSFQESLRRHNESYKDERVKAAFVMAPALGMAFSEAGLAGVDVPVHVVVPEGDKVVPPKTNGHRFAELIDGADIEVLAGPVDHYVFLCEATECGKRLEPDCAIDHSLVDRRQIHLHVGEQAVMFFDRHL